MRAVSLAVVVPAGPCDEIADTVESVLHFTSSPRAIVVVDDTGKAATRELESLSPDIKVLPARVGGSGTRGRLWCNVAAGYSYALEHFEFDVLLRLDADALLIGHGIASLAADRFAQEPGIGLLGSHRFGMDDGVRDWSWPAAQLARECGPLGWVRPDVRRTLRKLRSEALRNGYVAGEHPLAAVSLYTSQAVAAIERRGWLRLDELRRSGLGDDHLFAMMVVAAGFGIGEFARPDDPLAVGWKRLPAAPEDLLARRKVATHSVRGWRDLDEAQVRAYFAAARAVPGD